MKSSLILSLLVLSQFPVTIGAKGGGSNLAGNMAQRRRAKEAEAKQAIWEVKDRAKMRYCTPMEDDQMLFNCLHYHMNPDCFVEHFGEKGLSLGEWVENTVEKAFYKCWEEKGDKTMKPGQEGKSSKFDMRDTDVKTYQAAFDQLDTAGQGHVTLK